MAAVPMKINNVDTNLSVRHVGFHIKLHENTQIFTKGLPVVVQMPSKLTIALTSGVKSTTFSMVCGFIKPKLL
jgi:hypothetical protein